MNVKHEPGELVKHRSQSIVGLILKKSKIHKDYYYVLAKGLQKEWHISNIALK